MINANSLGQLFYKVACTSQNSDGEDDRISPYFELIEMMEVIYSHLARITEKNEFGDSVLLYDINQTIRHIAIVINNIIEHHRQLGTEEKRPYSIMSVS